ncbi:MAG: hypothetical protein PVF74_04890 [Anaerolineales bacterium]|jgi:cell division protein FtsL
MESVRSLTQAYSQAPWRKQLKYIVLFLVMVVFAALIAGIYLDVTARAATMGREVLIMESEIADLQLEIADLETKLAIVTSASEMEERARNMGFQPIEMDQAMYVIVPGYIPPEQITIAPPSSPVRTIAATLPPDFTESLFDWLKRTLFLPSERAVGVEQ